MRFWSHIAVIFAVLIGQAVAFDEDKPDPDAAQTDAPVALPDIIDADELKDIEIRGPLGLPLGKLVNVVAEAAGKSGDQSATLRIDSVDDESLEKTVAMPYEWSKAADANALSDGNPIPLQGFQSGRFVGDPAPAATGSTAKFEFQTYFVIVRRLDDKKHTAQVEQLIERLVLEDDDVFMQGTSKFVKRETSILMNNAMKEIKDLGRSAWPTLISHFEDKESSIPVRPAKGKHSRGVVCQHIVRQQVLDLPDGYPGAEPRIDKDGKPQISPGVTWGYEPGLKEWLKLHRDDSLQKIRIAAVKSIIALEDKIGYADDAAKADVRGPLVEHLESLEHSDTKLTARPFGQ